jgi:DNA polymerase elongation subunit (family B)
MRDKRRIIIFDIETMPIMSEVFAKITRLSQWPGLTMKADINSCLCIGWKEFGSKKTNLIAAWDFPQWEKDVNDDSEVLKAWLKVIKDADVIVTQNGKKFDYKFINTRLLINKLDIMPPGVAHVDTKQIAKRNLFLVGNRLDDLAEVTDSEKKHDHGEGWDLWVKVYARDQKAMNTMAKYCKQDVKTTEEVFRKLRPFVKEMPNSNLWTMEKVNCPTCGSLALQKNGLRTTKTKIMQRFKCDECGSHSQMAIKDNMVKGI